MKDDNFTPAARKTMAILAVVVGLFVIFVGPFLIQATLDVLMEKIASLIPTQPQFILTGVLLPIAFITLRGIEVVAGITLALIAYPLWKGDKWAWPVALLCLSLPTMFGVITTLPYIVQFGKPSSAGIILLVGLVVYWTFLLLKKGDRSTKIARFFTFTMLGLVPGHLLVLVNHGIKGLLDRPDKPMFTDPMITIYGFEAPLNSIALVMCIIAIPLLASRSYKLVGWWLGLIAGVTVIIANYPTHFVRMQTSDFFVAGTLGLLLVISLLIPAFKERLLEAE
jgi:uncharacterized membrane protein